MAPCENDETPLSGGASEVPLRGFEIRSTPRRRANFGSTGRFSTAGEPLSTARFRTATVARLSREARPGQGAPLRHQGRHRASQPPAPASPAPPSRRYSTSCGCRRDPSPPAPPSREAHCRRSGRRLHSSEAEASQAAAETPRFRPTGQRAAQCGGGRRLLLPSESSGLELGSRCSGHESHRRRVAVRS